MAKKRRPRTLPSFWLGPSIMLVIVLVAATLMVIFTGSVDVLQGLGSLVATTLAASGGLRRSSSRGPDPENDQD